MYNNTCFKGEGSCMDLILTNRKYSFKSSTSFETSLSNHHHLIYSIVKKRFHIKEPKKLFCCDYKTFFLETISSELFSKLESQENNDFETFFKNFVVTFNNQAPERKKYFEVTRGLILIRF